MQNWGDAQNIVNNAVASTGSLMDAQEVYLDSIEGKTKKLGAAWEEFSTNLLDSGIVKFFVDILTILGKILNFFVSFGNGVIVKFGAAMGVVAALIAILKKLQGVVTVTGATIKTQLDKIWVACKKFMGQNAPMLIISGIITLMTTLEGEARGWTTTIIGFISAVFAAVVFALKGTEKAIKAFEASNPIGWILLVITGVIAVIKGIFDLIESFNPPYEKLKDKAKESYDEWEKANNKLKETEDQLAKIADRIDELKSKGQLDLVDEKELEYLEALNSDVESQKSAAENAKKTAATDAAAALQKYNDTKTVEGSKWWQWLISPWWGAGREIASAMSDSQEAKFNKILANWKDASDEDKKFVEDAISEYRDVLKDFQLGDNAELDPYIRQFYSLLDRHNMANGKTDVVWGRVTKDTRFTGELEELKKLANEWAKTGDAQVLTIDVIKEKAPEFIKYLQDIGMYTEGSTKSADALTKSIQQLRDQITPSTRMGFTDDLEEMQDKLNSLSNALSDIKSIGVVSMEHIGKILDASAEGYPELLSKYFDYVEGVGYKLAKEWSEKSNVEILTAMANDEIGKQIEKYEAVKKAREDMGEDHVDYQKALEKERIEYENCNTAITKWATLLRAPALEEETERLNKDKDALKEKVNAYKDLIQVRKDLLKTYKEEVDYQKELAKKQKNLADLQTQLALAQLDNSAAGQALARELQSEITKAQEELDEYTLEKAIDDLTKQLDSDAAEYEKFIQEQVDKIVETINNLARDFKINFNDNGSATATSVPSHHSGGFVGAATLRSNEEFAKLLNGELVSTPRQMDNFMKKTLPALVEYGGTGGAQINNNAPLVEITCGRVDEDTLPELKDLVNEAVERISKNMESALHRTGYKKKY